MADKYTEARNRATAKYTRSHYDTGNVKLPIGTHERIRATGATVNGYINRAVLDALARDESGENLAPVYLPAGMLREAEGYGDPGEICMEALREILAEYRAGLR